MYYLHISLRRWCFPPGERTLPPSLTGCHPGGLPPECAPSQGTGGAQHCHCHCRENGGETTLYPPL